MFEQDFVTRGIIMSRRVEWVLVTKQKIVVLLKAKPIVIEGVLVPIIVRYSELGLH